jgi:TIR domain
MSTPGPLQVLLFRNPADSDVLPYEDAIVRALQGGKEAGDYLATGEDLGIQLEIFSSAPPRSPADILSTFCHSVTIVLIDKELLAGDDAMWDWLAECWNLTKQSKGQHVMLAIPMDERIGSKFSVRRPGLDLLQLLQVHDLGEKMVRPATLSLRILHACRVALATALPQEAGAVLGYFRLFISHAKMDGLPLAHSLKHLIEGLGLTKFYDVDDLPPGCDWQEELEKGVGSSLIIMLRTEGYESRAWCRQEVLWADEYATPAVLVEARTGLQHPSGILPLDRVPSVRIPDGNLMRVLFLALREGLRFLLFFRRIEQMKNDGTLPQPAELRVFCYPPSMAALLRACYSLSASTAPPTHPRLIIYPDPTLRTGAYEAAQALVASHAPSGTLLVTPNTLAATTGGTP